MADRVVTELILDNTNVKVKVGETVAEFHKLGDAFAASAKVMDITGAQSAAKLKANYDRLVASFDPITQAQYRFATEFERQQRRMDDAVKRSVVTQEQATAALTRLRNQQMAQLNQMRAMGAANQNIPGLRSASQNVGFQFGDIGMMIASGQNPLTLAAQQGVQLADALRAAQAAGGSLAATLLTGLSSVLNPMTLLTVGAVALTGAAVQYGAAWLSSGEEAERSMEDQVALADKLVDRYGAQLGLIQQIAAERKADAERAELVLGTADATAEARRRFIEGNPLGAARQALPGYGAADPAMISGASAMLDELQRKLATGEMQANDFRAAAAGLPPELASVASALGEVADRFAAVTAQIRGAEGAAAGITSAYPGFGNPVGLPGTLQRGQERERMRIYAREYGRLRGRSDVPVDSFDAPTPTPRPNDIERLDEAAEATDRLRKAEERRAETVRKLITGAQDTAEMAKLRVATFGMEETARQRLLDQLKIEQDLRARGADLTGAQADQYRQAALAASEYTIQLSEMEKRQQEVNEAQAFFGDLAMDSLNSLISGGEKFEDVMKRVGLAIADAMLKAALFGQGPLAAIFGWQPQGGQQYGGIVGDILNAGKASGAPTVSAVAGIDPWSGLRGGAARHVGGAGSSPGNFGSGSITDYIMAQAPKYGISADAALALARAEGGLSDPFRQAEAILSYGREQSFGPFQLHMRGGMGANALAAGIDPRTDWRGGVDYALWSAQRGGWGPWMGRQNAGLGIWSGIDRNAPLGPTPQAGGFSGADVAKLTGQMQQLTGTVGRLDTVVTGATGSVGGFGNTITQAAAALGGAGGGGGGGGILGMIFGGLGGFTGTTSLATGWGVRAALGGVFNDGISAFSGDIVSSPTLFKFARGAGLMGEAGPEAIMPLQRGPDGKLGVAANGGGMTVNVINQNGSRIETRQTDDGTLEVLVKNMEDRIASRMSESGSPLNKAAKRAAVPPLKRF